jgi:L-2,4-diaminobutyrate decarboxylase
MLDLVTKSLQTTRRFDALKLFVSLQSIGRKAFGEMIDTTVDLATATAQLVACVPSLELAQDPIINTVVFRYLPEHMPAEIDSTEWINRINNQIRLTLLRRGEAVIAQTQIGSAVYLKFTLLNPRTTLDHTRAILHSVQQVGRKLETDGAAAVDNVVTNRVVVPANGRLD